MPNRNKPTRKLSPTSTKGFGLTAEQHRNLRNYKQRARRYVDRLQSQADRLSTVLTAAGFESGCATGDGFVSYLFGKSRSKTYRPLVAIFKMKLRKDGKSYILKAQLPSSVTDLFEEAGFPLKPENVKPNTRGDGSKLQKKLLAVGFNAILSSAIEFYGNKSKVPVLKLSLMPRKDCESYILRCEFPVWLQRQIKEAGFMLEGKKEEQPKLKLVG
jgi:hypothetical protein